MCTEAWPPASCARHCFYSALVAVWNKVRNRTVLEFLSDWFGAKKYRASHASRKPWCDGARKSRTRVRVAIIYCMCADMGEQEKCDGKELSDRWDIWKLPCNQNDDADLCVERLCQLHFAQHSFRLLQIFASNCSIARSANVRKEGAQNTWLTEFRPRSRAKKTHTAMGVKLFKKDMPVIQNSFVRSKFRAWFCWCSFLPWLDATNTSIPFRQSWLYQRPRAVVGCSALRI